MPGNITLEKAELVWDRLTLAVIEVDDNVIGREVDRGKYIVLLKS